MRVARGVYKVAGLEPGYLCHHLQQQGVACYVERHTQKSVGRALIELQRQSAVGHIELEKQVAGRQVHFAKVGHIPCRHNHAA